MPIQNQQSQFSLEHNDSPITRISLISKLNPFRIFSNWKPNLTKGNEEGLFNTFKENFPITDTRNQFVLEFLDYFVDPPRYSIQECIERGLTYSVPLKARLKLYCTDPEHEDFETIVQDVF